MGTRISQPTRKKVLLWSSEGLAEGLSDVIRDGGYEAAVYPDVHDIVAVCAAEVPNLIVMAEETAAPALIDRLDEDQRTARIPVLVLAAGGGPPACATGLRDCRIDWLDRGAPEADVLSKIRAMLRVAFAETTETGPRERDGLTKLYNRRYFDERLEREVERARRYGRKISCVMLDIDGLHEINESRGHATGDAILRALSDIMLSETRCSDITARYGGEEFALILPETCANDAGVLAERLRRSFADRMSRPASPSPSATLSCGVAMYPDHARDAMTLVRMADSATFQAKADGGNRTVVAFSGGGAGITAESGPTILLVEDNDYNRNVTSLVLRASGYEVIEAADGTTAMLLAKSERPDLVIIDVQLSGSNGLEATRRLTAMEEMRNVPVVALTGREMTPELDELVRAGCRGYIVKPVDTNSLATQIQTYLK
jgi:diguanylate cyclase (GGDEF)-like protein